MRQRFFDGAGNEIGHDDTGSVLARAGALMRNAADAISSLKDAAVLPSTGDIARLDDTRDKTARTAAGHLPANPNRNDPSAAADKILNQDAHKLKRFDAKPKSAAPAKKPAPRPKPAPAQTQQTMPSDAYAPAVGAEPVNDSITAPVAPPIVPGLPGPLPPVPSGPPRQTAPPTAAPRPPTPTPDPAPIPTAGGPRGGSTVPPAPLNPGVLPSPNAGTAGGGPVSVTGAPQPSAAPGGGGLPAAPMPLPGQQGGKLYDGCAAEMDGHSGHARVQRPESMGRIQMFGGKMSPNKPAQGGEPHPTGGGREFDGSMAPSNGSQGSYENQDGINIKPANKGLLHKEVGVPQGKKIPAAKVAAAKNSSDPAERKRAVFAQNAKSWNHDGRKKGKSK